MLKLNFIINSAILLALASGANAQQASRARWLMGTVCEISAHGPGAEAAVQAGFEEIARLEAVLSTFIKESEVSRLNSTGALPGPISQDLADLIDFSRRLHKETGGAYDPSFASAPQARGLEKISFSAEKRAIRLPRGGKLDFGAVGKGWALDKAAQSMREAGAQGAFINFGGQILSFGSPRSGGSWPVELRSPSCAGDADSTGPCRTWRVNLAAGSASTSSQSERPGHIVDPKSGAPARRAGSVTVLAPTGAEADAWSTALFVNPKLSTPHCLIAFDGTPVPRLSAPCRLYDIQEKKNES